MKIRGNEVWWKSDNGNVAVAYSQFDLGAKYKVYRKVMDDAGWALGWRFADAFEFPTQALDFLRKAPDLPFVVN